MAIYNFLYQKGKSIELEGCPLVVAKILSLDGLLVIRPSLFFCGSKPVLLLICLGV